jgi:3-oxoacyl-(acyl-carrier-protein) synthase
MTKQKVFVTGTGVISAIGNTIAENFKALQNQESGIAPAFINDIRWVNSTPVGEVKLTNYQLQNIVQVSAAITRTSLLGIHAAREAMMSSHIKQWKTWRTGLISATTVGGMDKTEKFFSEFVKSPKKGKLRDVINHECGRTTELIADAIGVRGFVSTVNTACSSSVNSIMLGKRLIEQGMLDVVIAGGTDALTAFTQNGFSSLMILDKDLCKPFDATRNGLNLGEGAAFLVLASEKVLQSEKISPLCVISGYANTNDAYHQTASSPDGRGSYSAMQGALAMAELNATDISYINLHGTGTINNDLSEGTAIRRLFGEKLPRLSSTKAYTGHTLGASGAIEAVYSIISLQQGCVFPNLRFTSPLPETGITPQREFESGVTVKHVMSNSFGFGGNCSSIIFSKAF